jgi:deazaflavin-dependent oxidoreductase (nitroreductase family)
MTMNDFNAGVISEFRANHGKVGQGFENSPMVILHTTGAKSGQKRENPLVPLLEGDRMYVVASKGGAPTNPDWYYNVVAHPEVEVEFGDERFAAEAVVIEQGPERDRLYAAQVAVAPGFGEYVKTAAPRVIPIVEIRRRG